VLALATCGYPAPARIDADTDIVDTSIPEIDADTTGWPTNGGIGPRTCTGSHDEDDDGRADDCDVCPLDADPAQADQDRDGIGDICDPHPAYAVERLAYYSTFDGTLAAEGTKIGTTGTWVVEASLLRQTSTTQSRTLFLIAGGPWRRPAVELKIASIQQNGTTTSWMSGAYIMQNVTPTTAEPRPLSILCTVRFGDIQLVKVARLRDIPTFDAAEIEKASAPLPAVTDVTAMCAAERLGELPFIAGGAMSASPSALANRVTIGPDSTDVDMSRIGLWTYYGRSDIAGIAVFETIYPP
jgi:hypothetical protein